MQSYSANIIVSGSPSSYFSSLCGSGNIRVDSVHHAIGSTPGVALLSIPKLRPQAVGNLALNEVNIFAFGGRIFHGKIWEVRLSESAYDTNYDIIAYDSRVELGVNAIGDPRNTAQWNRIGWNVVFNRGNKPNNVGGEIVNNSDLAEYWTINDILEYVGEKYVNNSKLSTSGWNSGEFSSLSGSSVIPGEVDLTGMTISEAIDMLVQKIGSASWTIDYGTNKIKMVSLESPGDTRVVNYAVANTPVTWGTSNEWTIVHDAKVGRNMSIAVSGNAVSEHTLSYRYGGIARDKTWKSGIYVQRFIPSDFSLAPVSEGEDDGIIPIGEASPGTIPIGEPEDSDTTLINTIKTRNLKTLPWGRNLVSRRNVEGNGYIDKETYAGNPELGSEVVDRECIWILNGRSNRMRLISGYDISYDPPGIYLEEILIAVDQYDTEQEILVSQTDLGSDEGFWDIQMTVSVPHDINAFGMEKISSGWDELGIDLASYSEHRDMVPLVRMSSLLPRIDVDDSAHVIQTDEEVFYNPTNKIQSIAEGELESFKLVHRELTATLPIPQLINIGDKINFLPIGGGGSVLGESVICTCVDHYFDIEQKTVIRAENQMGTSQSMMRPMSSKNLGYWRYSSRIKLMEQQAQSNRRFAEHQRAIAKQALEEAIREHDNSRPTQLGPVDKT